MVEFSNVCRSVGLASRTLSRTEAKQKQAHQDTRKPETLHLESPMSE